MHGFFLCRYTRYCFSNMGRTPKFQTIEAQNPMKVPFSNKDLVWTNGVQCGGKKKCQLKLAMCHMFVSQFVWKVNTRIHAPLWSGTHIKMYHHN
jgi:hypothetical protein